MYLCRLTCLRRIEEYSPVNPAWCAYMSKQEYEVVLEKFHMLRDEIVKNTVQ